MKILHIITNLATGGAEHMLERLVTGLRPHGHDPLVVSLRQADVVGARLAAAGFRVEALGMAGPLQLPGALLRLRRLVRAHRPDVVQGWMYHGNVAATLACRGGGPPHAWNIRCTPLEWKSYSLSSSAGFRLSRALSRAPAVALFNSHASEQEHHFLGFRCRDARVIPNGVDTGSFRPDAQARGRARARLGIPPDAVVVGQVARHDPQKDHPTLLQAAARVAARRPGTVFVLAGRGLSWDNRPLAQAIDALKLRHAVRLAGEWHPTQELYPAFDLNVLSSAFGEAFPNVLAEAMACGVPCVATDVGDSALIVGDTGWIVPPRQPEALGDAILEALSALSGGPSPRGRGEAARSRIQARFEVGEVLRRYEALYEEVAACAASPA